MAVAYKSAGAGASTQTNGAALSPLCPAVVDAGDVLIAHVYVEGTTAAPSTPTGWTLLDGPRVVQSTIARKWVYGKIADGSEDGAAVAFGSFGGTSMRAARVYSFSGRVSGTITELVKGFSFTTHATDPQMPTVRTTETGSLAVALVSQNDDNTLSSATGETGGDWTQAVAHYEAPLTPGFAIQIQTCIPTGDPGEVTGGSVAATNDPSGVIGFEIRPNPPVELEQKAYRFRNDDGNETTATWKAAQNTDVELAEDATFRIRFEVQAAASGGDRAEALMQLQYNLNGAGWNDVTTASAVLRSVAGANSVDGVTSTDQLTAGTGTFNAGECDGSNARALLTDSAVLSAGEHSEVEFVVQLQSADVAPGDDIQMRVIDFTLGTTLTYTATPTASIPSTSTNLSAGVVSSPASVSGADLDASGAAPLSLSPVSSLAEVLGVTLVGAGAGPLSVSPVLSAAVVKGVNLSGSGSVVLLVGLVSSAGDVPGADLSPSGSAPLALGLVSSPGDVPGADLSASGSTSLALGLVSSPATVLGAALVVVVPPSVLFDLGDIALLPDVHELALSRDRFEIAVANDHGELELLDGTASLSLILDRLDVEMKP